MPHPPFSFSGNLPMSLAGSLKSLTGELFMTFCRVITVFVLAVASCLASDADGKWAGNINTPNGPIPVSFDLTTNGNVVTGTTVGPQGEVKITNGKLEGNLLSFALTFNVAGTNLTIRYKGIVSNDHINFTLSFGDDPTEFVVKRVS